MKRKVVDVLLITLVFTACVVKVAPNAGQSEKNDIENVEKKIRKMLFLITLKEAFHLLLKMH